MEMPYVKEAVQVGCELAEQLVTWREENDWSAHQVSVSPTFDTDEAVVELEFGQFDDLITRKVLAYSMKCGLSEDFELVSSKTLKTPTGIIAGVVFTVRGL